MSLLSCFSFLTQLSKRSIFPSIRARFLYQFFKFTHGTSLHFLHTDSIILLVEQSDNCSYFMFDKSFL